VSDCKSLQVTGAVAVDRGRSDRVGENRKEVTEPRNCGGKGYLEGLFYQLSLSEGRDFSSRTPMKGRFRYSSP
jgi:hypothetical protein